MNTSSPYIREATSRDMNEIAKLHKTTYSNAGYVESCDNPQQSVSIDSMSSNDHRTVFVACIHNEYQEESIVGTVSMSEYNDISLSPLVDDFSDTLHGIAKKKEKCVIIWRLAVLEEYRHSLNISLLLIEAIVDKGSSRDFTTVVCTVHPKHYSFYKKCFGLEKVDECKNITGLVNAPAFLLLGEFEKIRWRFMSLRAKKKARHQLNHSNVIMSPSFAREPLLKQG